MFPTISIFEGIGKKEQSDGPYSLTILNITHPIV